MFNSTFSTFAMSDTERILNMRYRGTNYGVYLPKVKNGVLQNDELILLAEIPQTFGRGHKREIRNIDGDVLEFQKHIKKFKGSEYVYEILFDEGYDIREDEMTFFKKDRIKKLSNQTRSKTFYFKNEKYAWYFKLLGFEILKEKYADNEELVEKINEKIKIIEDKILPEIV